MKIILSRKGFDAGIGKVASPILPSGELCSLPIPESFAYDGAIRYSDLQFDGQSLGKLVCDLTRGKIAPDQRAHLDPDLRRETIPRMTAWRPLFGQAGAAERHLQNRGLRAGDLFLFYGWFRRVELYDGTYRYVPGAPDLHVLFGWLQVERSIPITMHNAFPAWAMYHPHCRRALSGISSSVFDSLYISTGRLSLPDLALDLPGAGTFRCYHPSLCLTNLDPYTSRRLWRLPEWIFPTTGKTPMSYHSNRAVWQRARDGSTLLKSAGRGQEFVLDCEEYPQALEWVVQILARNGLSVWGREGGNADVYEEVR
jgi:hypothetical protein